ncbi:YfhO family protein [Candidatus Microgenomates bacterium]|nr:YfhO family protein [Candidatus Microgenomates bacterium]
MKKFSFLNKHFFIILISILVFPTFLRMLRPGIFSMQDFHYFRLFEFDKCIADLQIPCRWSQDVGLGFGEPLFNFYGQLSYVFGEVLRLANFSLINSLKIVFILSLILSAVSMYFLAKDIWEDNLSALVSSILYVYAPYRAVDVWVRGALPESVSFVFYPLIILFFEKYLKTNKKTNLLLFGLLVSLLILNHNLSFVLFLPFLVIWVVYRIISLKKWKNIGNLLIVTILSLGIVAFYVFPVINETKYVTLENTIQGYFDFRGHFAGVKQLLFSTNWGYGASVFGPKDDLNISIGFLQWIVPFVSLLLITITRKTKYYREFFVLLLISLVFVFLINNKSIFVWDSLPQMAYIQFPWRFLGVLVFSLSLAAGAGMKVIPEKFKLMFCTIIIIVSIALNFSNFRPDIWYNYTDTDLTQGKLLNEQMAASIGDYWPKTSEKIATNLVENETREYKLILQKSNMSVFEIKYDQKQVSLPVNYFPGWQAYSDNGMRLETKVGDNGLIKVINPTTKVHLKFENTKVRQISNIISFISVIVFLLIFTKYKLYEKNK